MNAYRAGAPSVTLPNGAWLIPAPAPGAYHMSLANMHNFTIDGNGATLVYADPRYGGLQVANSDHLTIKNLQADYAIPVFSQGKIINIGSAREYIDIQVDAGYPTNLLDASYFGKILSLTLYHPTTLLFKEGINNINTDTTTQLSPDTFRLTSQWGFGNVAVGDFYAHRANGAFASQVANSAAVTFTNYSVYTGGFGFAEQGGAGGHVYDHVAVTYGPIPAGATKRRLVSTCADAFHSSGVRQGPTISHSLFEGSTDDGFNIHGAFSIVVSSSANSAMVGSAGTSTVLVGDQLKFMDPQGHYRGSAIVTAVAQAPAGYTPPFTPAIAGNNVRAFVQVTLNTNLGILANDVMWNHNAGGDGFAIENSTYRNLRGNLEVKADNGRIVNNTFDGLTLNGLYIDPGYPFYGEASFVENLVVQNNIFTNISRAGGTLYKTIVLGSSLAGQTHRGVHILNNNFTNNYGVDIDMSAATNIEIKNNFFNGKTSAQKALIPNFSSFPVMNFFNINGLNLAGNTFPPDQPVAINHGDVTNIVGVTMPYWLDSYESFSSDQGPTWLYQYAPIGSNTYTSYTTYSIYGWWNGTQSQRNYADGGFFTGKRIAPGYHSDPVLTLVIPKTGVAMISAGDNGISTAGSLALGPGSAADGARVSIWKNNTQIWPASGWVTIMPGQSYSFPMFSVSVVAGDRLHFRSNMNTNASKDLRWDPVVRIP